MLGSPAHLSDFVITTLFEALLGSTYSASSQDGRLKVWFKSYRDIMALPALKQYIYMYSFMAGSESKEWRRLEAKLNLMQATFLTILSCPSLSHEALLKGKQTFQTLLGRYFQENTEVRMGPTEDIH